MNKAFTKEDSENDNDDDIESAPLPLGKNYVTPHGFTRYVSELKQLKNKERPELCKLIEWAVGNGDRSENGDYIYGKKRLREIDRRIRYLSKRIESAEVIDPLKREKTDKVYFGATVTIRNQDDIEKIFSIVGIDEVDVAKGRISWMSPIGAALLKGELGDVVSYVTPKGVQEVEIVGVEYREIV